MALSTKDGKGDSVGEQDEEKDSEREHYKKGNGNILMVAAIDFGTTYSGYAYSMKADYEKDKISGIYSNQPWNSGRRSLMSLKTPTCILIRKKDREFQSFGYDAENDYTDIVIDEEVEEYYFFDRFKMMLYTREDISKDMILQDIRGKSLPAIDVFAAAIKALKQHMLGLIKKNSIKDDEIKWVLTVPAMWTDKAKEFMRESAERAGIREDRLMIALEPEAASIYCQCLPSEKISGSSEGFSDTDTKYLVVDLGGGTVDITAHHKVNEDELKELISASGGACGGTTVDKDFLNLLQAITGERVMETLQKERTASYLDLLREFETVKRTVSSRSRALVTFSIPIIDFNELCQQFLEREFKAIVADSKYDNKIQIVRDKMRMDRNLMASLFDNASRNIVQEIRNVLARVRINIDTFLLVGGFSESPIIQNAIQEAFPNVSILTPRDDPGLAVVKGAVVFGHKPDFIISRVTRYTYGRRIRPLFDESKHDPCKRIGGEGGDRCHDVFEMFMPKNQCVPLNHVVTVTYHTVMSNQASVSVAIYYTLKESANYVDEEGCRKLGEFSVPIPDPSTERRYVDVKFKFGRTKLKVTAKERQSKQKTQYSYSFISMTAELN